MKKTIAVGGALFLMLQTAACTAPNPVGTIPTSPTTVPAVTTTATPTTAAPTTVTTTTTTVATTVPSKAPTESIEYTVDDPLNTRGLSTEKFSFSFGVASGGQPHGITVNNQKRFDEWDLDTLCWDNQTTEKVLYLTFDCGYQYGDLVPRMLDTLKEKQVQATFFCTLHYLKTAPTEVSRMLAEGHFVGNHTAYHPSDPAALTRQEMADEVMILHNYMRNTYGYDCRYFRFPSGVYSHNAVDVVAGLGYRSVFWSIAHADWDPDNQPGTEKSFQTVTERLHPGAVILLHSTSPDNADVLGRIIDYAKDEGYTFRSLDEYPW